MGIVQLAEHTTIGDCKALAEVLIHYLNNTSDYKKAMHKFKLEGKAHQSKKEPPLELKRRYTPDKYPKLANFEAINVNYIRDIPKDYEGIIGVPVTYWLHWCPEQFEILGMSGDKEWCMHECNFFKEPT